MIQVESIVSLNSVESLLKKQYDQGLPCLLFRQAFCEFQPWKPTFH